MPKAVEAVQAANHFAVIANAPIANATKIIPAIVVAKNANAPIKNVSAKQYPIGTKVLYGLAKPARYCFHRLNVFLKILSTICKAHFVFFE